MSEILKIGAEFDVSQIVAGSAQASASLDKLTATIQEQAARMEKQGFTADETAKALVNLGYSAKAVASALGSEAEATNVAANATRSYSEANIQARLTTDALTGNISRAENALIRFASHGELIGPIMQAAFAPIAVGIFVDLLVNMAEKFYHVYENVVLLKDAIEQLDRVDMAAAEHAATLNYAYEESIARRLESQGRLTEATAAYRLASGDKPLEIPKIDDKLFKQFNSEFVTFLQAVHTSADAPSVITRINAEAAATSEQLKKAKENLASMGDLSGEALAYGGGGALLGNAQAQVDQLTKKLDFLKAAISEVQSQTGVAGNTLADHLDRMGKTAEAAAKRASEAARAAAYANQQSLNETQMEAARGAAEELRQIEAVERKKEAAAKKAFDDAWREFDLNMQVQEDITRGVQQELAKRESLRRQEELTDAAIQAQIDTNTKKASEATIREWGNAEKSINRAFDQMLSGVLMGTQTISQAFARMGADMVMSVIIAFEKITMHTLMKEAMMLTAHVATNEAKVASDASAAAQSDTIGKTADLVSITRAAATAAAHSFKWVMEEVPFPVNVALAPVVAAGTFLAVEGFKAMAGAEHGAYVQKDMPIFAHAGEMVLPKHLTEGLSKLIAGGQGGGTQVMVNALDAASFRDYAHRNQRQLIASVRGMIRNGAR